MSDNITKMSDDTQVAMPLRNIISIVAGVAVATWAYGGVIERINNLETNSTLNQQDISLNNEFRVLWPRGEMGNLPADARQDMEIESLQRYMDAIMEEVEENDDWIDEFGPPAGVLATVERVRELEVEVTLLEDQVQRLESQLQDK
jgi:predicted nuclease with TOPRIM domain